jgi:PST family polysaccharide transporter
VVRDLVRDPGDKEETLGTAAFLQFFGGLISYGLILAVIFWLRADDAMAKAIVAIIGSMMLFKSSEIAVYWFESQVLSKYIIWIQNGVFLIFAIFKVGLILKNAPLIAFAWAMMAEALVVAVLMIFILGLRGPHLRQLRVGLVRAQKLLSDSWPLIVSSIAIVAYMKIDQIMLSQMIGDEAVGVYSAAARISEVWYFVAIALNSSFRPTLIKLRETDPYNFAKRLQQIFNLMVQLSFVVGVFVSMTSPYLIQILFGDPYTEANNILRIHVWAGVFVFLNNAVWIWYIAENKQKLANIRILVGLSLNIALNYVLIFEYGAVGAAVATLISRAFVAYAGQLLTKDTRHIFFMMTRAIFSFGFCLEKNK